MDRKGRIRKADEMCTVILLILPILFEAV